MLFDSEAQATYYKRCDLIISFHFYLLIIFIILLRYYLYFCAIS